MIRKLLGFYAPKYVVTIVYMLQSTEYQIKPYLRWYWRTTDFRRVMYRRKLHRTKVATLLLIAMMMGMILQIIAGITLIWLWNNQDLNFGLLYGAALLISYPVIWAHLVVLPLVFGRMFIIWPRDQVYIWQSRKIFREHPGIKIAVAGSYGKTSMKELLLTVLSEGKHTVATPANKNVASSHAKFARTLKGNEEIVIIEYGEGRPGDVARFSKTTAPNRGIITGIAPAHLDHYPSLEAAAKDIFSLADYLKDKDVYVNSESPAAEPYIKAAHKRYSSHEALGWSIGNITLSIEGTSFDMKKGSIKLHLKSGLIGKHNVGPLALVAALAHELGLSESQIEQGVANTEPFDHRLQPRMVSGAWIIDDTYNGNIDGVRAGLEVLRALKARRKIYVTPGLVDQGRETVNVHHKMGEFIVAANPDSVILMNNSATKYIKEGLEKAGFKGGLMIEHDPLKFYYNIDQFVAAGDIVLMQNDWTDNYN